MQDTSDMRAAMSTVRDLPLNPNTTLDAVQSTEPIKTVTPPNDDDDTQKQMHKQDKVYYSVPLKASAATTITTADDRDVIDSNNRSSATKLQLAAGAFLETTEAQLAIVLLIALDVCSTAVQMHLRDQQIVQQLRAVIDASDANSFASTSAASQAPRSLLLLTLAAQLVESFTGFTLFFFLIELAVLGAAFRRRFFLHVGYVLDAAVVVTAISYEVSTQSKALRLFGVLRVWRVFRLVNTLIERERRAHDATKDALEHEQLRALQLETERQAACASLEREYASRASLERLLQSFKDEIETLKEALQIAAEAVAEAELQSAVAATMSLNPLSATTDARAPEDDTYTDKQYAAYNVQLQGEYEDWSDADEYAEPLNELRTDIDVASVDEGADVLIDDA